jgi:hypothetical protein
MQGSGRDHADAEITKRINVRKAPKVKVGDLTVNYDQQGTGEPLVSGAAVKNAR